jgi:hypothetical protein
MKKKGIAVGVILLFIGIAVSPSVNVAAEKNPDDTTITVEFVGLNDKKSYSSEVSSAQVLEIKSMLETQTTLIENAATSQESFDIITETCVKLESYGLIEKNDVQCFVELSHRYDNSRAVGKLQKFLDNNSFIQNIFAFVIFHATGGVTDLGLLSLPGVLFIGSALAYKFHGNILLALFCLFLGAILAGPSLIYNKVSPLKFWVILLSLHSESWSIGLKGFQYQTGSLAIGFKGLRIKLPGEESYYLGHTLLLIGR